MNQQGYNDEEAEGDFSEVETGRIVTCDNARDHFVRYDRFEVFCCSLELTIQYL